MWSNSRAAEKEEGGGRVGSGWEVGGRWVGDGWEVEWSGVWEEWEGWRGVGEGVEWVRKRKEDRLRVVAVTVERRTRKWHEICRLWIRRVEKQILNQ